MFKFFKFYKKKNGERVECKHFTEIFSSGIFVKSILSNRSLLFIKHFFDEKSTVNVIL